MTSAVVNSSPLIHLGDIGRVDLLHSLFESVETPVAVAEEIRAKGDEDPAARAIAAATWLHIVTTPVASAPLLAWDLGAGETAVLAQAMAQPGTEAIIDDLAARRCAKAFGVPVCGTLGLVPRAARKGIVPDPVGMLIQLRDAGMWLSPGLFEQVLSNVGLRWTRQQNCSRASMGPLHERSGMNRHRAHSSLTTRFNGAAARTQRNAI